MPTIREQISEVVERAYAENNIVVKPFYPNVLVRVLPRAQRSGSGLLHLPDKQNKVLIEGVVLATFKPFYQVFKTERVGEKETVTRVLVEPQSRIGDHVMFKHWLGAPLEKWVDGYEYRLVSENEFESRLDYEKHEALTNWVTDVLHDQTEPVKALLSMAYVIPKDKGPLTTSGA